jgi:hypothetical protein
VIHKIGENYQAICGAALTHEEARAMFERVAQVNCPKCLAIPKRRKGEDPRVKMKDDERRKNPL